RPMLVLWTLGFVLAGVKAMMTKEVAARGTDFKLLFGFMAMLGLSLVFAGWAGGAIDAMNNFSTSSMLFVLVALNVTSLRRLKLACAAVVLSMLIAALFGIQAYHTGQYVDQLVLRQVAPVHEEDDPSRAPPSVASEIPALDLTGWYLWRVRGQGFLSDPNDFSQALVMCLPLLFVLWRQRAWIRNLLLVVAPGAVMMYAIVLSQSRGALLGVASLLFFIVRDWLGTTRTAILGGAAAVLFLGASAVGGRGFSSQEQSAGERIEAWAVGLELLKWRPLWGAGYGNFLDHHNLTAHNSFVLCFAELGLMGYFLWIGMIVLTYKSLSTTVELLPLRSPHRQMAVLMRNALVGFLVCAWFLSRTYQPVLYFLLALCVATWWCASHAPGLLDQESSNYEKMHNIPWIRSTFIMMFMTIVAVRAFVFSHQMGRGG
ncbi:MAG: hypothetical protein QG612_1889, partial [Pseudomonadota bacterium]|nr:hypothetical protein [Pseudomonadota bacterium]